MAGYQPEPPFPAPPGKHWTGYFTGSVTGFGKGSYVWHWRLIDENGPQQENVPEPAPDPPHMSFSFDTIGQIIPRTYGHCRTALRIIWVYGISESGEETTSRTITAAYAMSMPIDPEEEGSIDEFYDGFESLWKSGTGLTAPEHWTPEDQAALASAIAGMTVYPGTQAQLPAPIIVADKGGARTPAWRGLRYVIIPGYPLTNGLPRITIRWKRTGGGGGSGDDFEAVEFAAGAG